MNKVLRDKLREIQDKVQTIKRGFAGYTFGHVEIEEGEVDELLRLIAGALRLIPATNRPRASSKYSMEHEVDGPVFQEHSIIHSPKSKRGTPVGSRITEHPSPLTVSPITPYRSLGNAAAKAAEEAAAAKAVEEAAAAKAAEEAAAAKARSRGQRLRNVDEEGYEPTAWEEKQAQQAAAKGNSIGQNRGKRIPERQSNTERRQGRDTHPTSALREPNGRTFTFRH